jgi:PhnB protein
MTNVEPYLIFNGNCEEAVNFYTKTFGGDIQFCMKFKDTPTDVPAQFKDKICHMSFIVESSRIMASDNGPGAPHIAGNNIQLSVAYQANNSNTMNDKFKKLAEGGNVIMPLQKTFWAENFGMVKDRFGICWMFNYEGAKK